MVILNSYVSHYQRVNDVWLAEDSNLGKVFTHLDICDLTGELSRQLFLCRPFLLLGEERIYHN